MRIVSAVLAAGASTRFGRAKAIVEYEGVPLVRRAIAAASMADVEQTAVILGAHAAKILPLLDPSVVPIFNLAWEEGMASSVRAAVTWAEQTKADALVLLLADQPLVRGAHVERLVSRWKNGAVAVASEHARVLGAPALFDRQMFGELARLSGDRGAASILRSRSDVERVPCPEAAVDVDTPADLSRSGRNAERELEAGATFRPIAGTDRST
jgi:CTP:molybdopterin cytidylyltransferase MocA